VTEDLSGGSCASSLANGAVPAKHRALLDTIAFTEGTRGHGQNGYNVTFAYHYFSSCTKHPNLRICSGRYCSTAADRYQFLTTTWTGLGYGRRAASTAPSRGAEALRRGNDDALPRCRSRRRPVAGAPDCIECFLCEDVRRVLRDHDKTETFAGPRFMHIVITDNAIIPLKERVADDFYDPVRWVLNKVFPPKHKKSLPVVAGQAAKK